MLIKEVNLFSSDALGFVFFRHLLLSVLSLNLCVCYFSGASQHERSLQTREEKERQTQGAQHALHDL